MDNIREVVMNLFGEYENVYMDLYSKRENVDFDDVEEEDIFPYVEEDLFDKGFSKEEIDEIVCHQMNENTFYKLGAYMIALYNQPETFEEWKISIKEDVMVKLPEEECKKLWDAYQTVGY